MPQLASVPRQPTSIRWRLMLLFGLVAALVCAVFGVLLDRAIEQHFQQSDGDELQRMAAVLAPLLVSAHAPGAAQSILRQRIGDLLRAHQGRVWWLDARDQLRFASHSVHPPSIPATGVIWRWHSQGHDYRVLQHSLPQADGTLLLAIRMDHHIRFMHAFHRQLAGMLLAAALLMGCLSWFAVRSGLAPLRQVSARLHRLEATDLDLRLQPHTLPAELHDLATSFNAMLERLQDAFARQAHFSDNIAHELRTPLASLLTQTQVALSRPRTAEEYQEVLYQQMAEHERLSRMVSDMLFLAQADSRLLHVRQTSLSLSTEASAVLDYYEALAEENGIRLLLTGAAQMQADAALLRRAISNVLANALRYCPRGKTVSLRIWTEGAVACLAISNPGPPIPATQQNHLFDRFYQADSARQRHGEGAGLGLSIVQAIMRMHGGTISLQAEDKETVFVLRFG